MGRTTTLRILNDIDGTVKTVDLQRDRGELIISLMHVFRIIHRQQKYFHLTVHFSHEIITIHWWQEGLDWVRNISLEFSEMCSITDRTLEMLQKARVGE